jgi:lipopolysaccharide transport protein LptA
VRVAAESLRYDDRSSRVYYAGKSQLWRNALTVNADTIEAIVRPGAGGGTSGLEWALARGNVSIHENGPAGERRGFGNEAEYWPDEGRIVLSGEPARMASPSGNETTGRTLTYSVDGDRLLVRGNTEERAFSARRKP